MLEEEREQEDIWRSAFVKVYAMYDGKTEEIRRDKAEDIAQEAFLKVWKRYRSKPHVERIFLARKIAEHLVYDEWRRASRHPQPLSLEQPVPGKAQDNCSTTFGETLPFSKPAMSFHGSGLAGVFDRAMEQMESPCKEILFLEYVLERSAYEASEVLGKDSYRKERWQRQCEKSFRKRFEEEIRREDKEATWCDYLEEMGYWEASNEQE